MNIHELEGGDIVKLVSVEEIYTHIPAVLEVVGRDFLIVQNSNGVAPSQAVCLDNGLSFVGPLVRGCTWE